MGGHAPDVWVFAASAAVLEHQHVALRPQQHGQVSLEPSGQPKAKFGKKSATRPSFSMELR